MLTQPVEALLREAGLRATPQRLAVYDALGVLSHPDVEAIYGYVQKHHASLSLATVYHVLDRFREAGLVGVLDVNGRRHYDIHSDRHDHLWCRDCGELSDVSRGSNTTLVEPRLEGWMVDGVALVWEGRCPRCQMRTTR